MWCCKMENDLLRAVTYDKRNSEKWNLWKAEANAKDGSKHANVWLRKTDKTMVKCHHQNIQGVWLAMYSPLQQSM